MDPIPIPYIDPRIAIVQQFTDKFIWRDIGANDGTNVVWTNITDFG